MSSNLKEEKYTTFSMAPTDIITTDHPQSTNIVPELTDTVYASASGFKTAATKAIVNRNSEVSKTRAIINPSSGMTRNLKEEINTAFSKTTTDTVTEPISDHAQTTKHLPEPGFAVLFSTEFGIYQMSLDGLREPKKKMKIHLTDYTDFDYDPISQQIFFVHSWTLKTSYLNGTNQRVIAAIRQYYKPAVEWFHRKLFIPDYDQHYDQHNRKTEAYVIRKYNMKTLTEESEIGPNDNLAFDISLDIFHSVMYWMEVEYEYAYIIRSNYNGENREILHKRVDKPCKYCNPCFFSLVVDYKLENIYFGCSFDIYKMKINGSDVRHVSFDAFSFGHNIIIQADKLLWIHGGTIRIANRLSQWMSFFEPKTLLSRNNRILDLVPFYIRSDNDNVLYDDLRCPEIARCFGINYIWTCLQPNMICDGNPQCHGEVDEFYCCHDNSYNCSTIQEVYLTCNRSDELTGFDQDSLEVFGWRNHFLFGIFGSNFLSFRCSLGVKYLDVNSIRSEKKFTHIQEYHILRQLLGPTKLRYLETLNTLTLSGSLPSIWKEAFKLSSSLNKLVITRTNLQHMGKHMQPQNESNGNHFNNFRTMIIYKNSFNGLNNLHHLILSENRFLKIIDNNAFHGLENMYILEIKKNENLAKIKQDSLNRLTNLRNLFISENSRLWKTNEYIFKDFTALENLTLSQRVLNKVTLTGNLPSLKKGHFHTDAINELLLLKTKIKYITGYFYGGLDNLKLLILAENIFLSSIKNNAFSGLTFLTHLTISRNPQLMNIENLAFIGLESLTHVSITNNPKILSLDNMHEDKYIFDYALNIIMLNISGNMLSNLKDGLLDNLTNLEVIDLRKNNLLLTSNIFKNNKRLAYIYSDSYSFCCLKPYVIFNKHCYAPIDDVSSCSDLIADRRLFGFLWAIGLIAFFGNLSVLLYRFINDRKSLKQTFSVFVVNLSCSDALMGLYMLIIAFQDSLYDGEYVWHDYGWKQSFLCKLSGNLAFTSSESSIIFIGLITIDRFLAVKYPIGGKRFTFRHAVILSVLAWIISLILAIVPVLVYSQFYSYSGTCLALPLTGNFNPGWQISVAIFLGFNCIMFVLITIGQFVILRMIIQSARRVGSKHSSKEREAAMFLFLVASTDALCWFPVAIIVSMALAGIPLSREIYAWIIIFVLPVNSAINPFLYTIVPLCRKKQKELRTAKVQGSGSSRVPDTDK